MPAHSAAISLLNWVEPLVGNAPVCGNAPAGLVVVVMVGGGPDSGTDVEEAATLARAD
jgi:hypothetical protein